MALQEPTDILPIFCVIWCTTAATGIAANIYVIYLISSRGLVRRTMNCYVLNLAVTDAIFLFVCPMVLTFNMLHPDWLFGLFGCRLLNFLTIWSVNANCWTLVLMTADRCVRIMSESVAVQSRSSLQVKLISCVIWTVSLVMTAPCIKLYGIKVKLVHEDETEMIPGEAGANFEATNSVIRLCIVNEHLSFFRVALVLMMVSHYIVPLMCIAFCYILIYAKIQKSTGKAMELCKSPRSNKSRNRANILMSAIFCTFALCWFPTSAYNLCLGIFYNGMPLSTKFRFYYKCTAHALTYANSCLNPIYNFVLNRGLRSELEKKYRADNEESRFRTELLKTDNCSTLNSR